MSRFHSSPLSRLVALGLPFAALSSSALAATQYYDTSINSGLQGGNGTWDAGTTSLWSPNDVTTGTTLTTWANGNIADFRNGSASIISVSGTVIAAGIAQSVNNTAVTLQGNGGNDDILQIGSSGVVTGNNGSVTFGSTLQIQLSANQTWRTGSNAAVVVNSNITETGAGGYTLTVDNATTFGNKSLQLAGTNTFGGLTVNAGGANRQFAVINAGSTTTLSNAGAAASVTGSGARLVVNGTLSQSGGGTLSATNLAGAGTINLASAVSTNLQAGTMTTTGVSSIGTLSFGSTLNLGAGANTVFQISGAANDAISTVSLLTYGGTLTLDITGLRANGTTLDLFAMTAGSAGDFTSVVLTGGLYNGTFSKVGENWTNTTNTANNAQVLIFSETTGDLTFAAVPEPHEWAVVIGGFLALTVFSRARRRMA